MKASIQKYLFLRRSIAYFKNSKPQLQSRTPLISSSFVAVSVFYSIWQRCTCANSIANTYAALTRNIEIFTQSPYDRVAAFRLATKLDKRCNKPILTSANCSRIVAAAVAFMALRGRNCACKKDSQQSSNSKVSKMHS
jgi:hypothetical protein